MREIWKRASKARRVTVSRTAISIEFMALVCQFLGTFKLPFGQERGNSSSANMAPVETKISKQFENFPIEPNFNGLGV